MAAAEVLKTPVLLKEQVYSHLEKALVYSPFDDFKNFVLHAAKDHAARSTVVDSISKMCREKRLEQSDIHLEYAEGHDEGMYEDLKAAIEVSNTAPASGDDWNRGADNWVGSTGSPPTAINASPAEGQAWDSGAEGFHDISMPDYGDGDCNTTGNDCQASNETIRQDGDSGVLQRLSYMRRP